jgi:hypothetical protein
MRNRLAGIHAGFLPRRDLGAGLSNPDIDQPFGEKPSVKSSAGEKSGPRGQRVLDGLAGVRVGGWLEMLLRESDADSFEI